MTTDTGAAKVIPWEMLSTEMVFSAPPWTEVSKDAVCLPISKVSGEKRKEKETKVAIAKKLWVPAVNNHGGFGRWEFIEIDDPWNAKNEIRGFMKSEDR